MPFYEIRLSVTGACNQNCIYCGPFVDGKYTRGYGNISLDQARQLVGELKNIINQQKLHIQITGGEPTLRSDLVEIFTLLNQEFADIGMTTNGSRLNTELTKKLVKNGLSDIHIHFPSLDIDAYEKTTRVEIGNDRVQNIIDSAMLVKKMGKRVEFNTPVTHINIGTLNDLFDFCYKNKINLKLIEELRTDDEYHVDVNTIKKILSDWINDNSIKTDESKIKNRYGIIYQFNDDFFFRIVPVYDKFRENLAGAPKNTLLDGRYWIGGVDNLFLYTPSYSLPPLRGTIEELKNHLKKISEKYKEAFN